MSEHGDLPRRNDGDSSPSRSRVIGRQHGSAFRMPRGLRRLRAIDKVQPCQADFAYADGQWFYTFTATGELRRWILSATGLPAPAATCAESQPDVDAVDPVAEAHHSPSTREKADDIVSPKEEHP